ncbi:ribonuclease P protein component [bacterium (Candidatus Blackallbacteria) CG17_big_fil_post_rev_8_21_14_2_50_48_46]|uniref:Ribonuclease P protein component n=1 Tax=bacterium (Candidatus Blackallbacteria) CG17_big_fil_post_rev_8_21_14_2_50_48_46 TaxID=2014261 RepID=A0A2M7G4Z9_9BACT|nr:MAG: ribonuclease P protein component [bacterium (Candidatus Blackallbacteria) CG18_big_fil_WC_8_21_14_2_50_49_26]PIW17026.1 MAG: ribonuclease P protein component [bacterium (Candidatus Blackallbacteria) CG17_big_fil_post_rev_8_21_14_2_50_48_46]PIW48166.1 MAG: ribonuclease P protein component [bacterium (Candidatus Blackallbacteria) CG13_big_fil_rev_8_21_14_2_50_49_14]
MLPREERLCRRDDFLRLQKKGKMFRSRLLRLVVAPAPDEQRLAGFTVSKRISKKATERNRIKRRLRAAYRCFYPQVAKGVFLLFIAQDAIRDAGFEEIQRQIDRLLREAGLTTGAYAGTSVRTSD